MKRRPPRLDHVFGVIGHLGPNAVQTKLRKAQAILYGIRDKGGDPSDALAGAASLIKGAGIALMKAAAELERLAREHESPDTNG